PRSAHPCIVRHSASPIAPSAITPFVAWEAIRREYAAARRLGKIHAFPEVFLIRSESTFSLCPTRDPPEPRNHAAVQSGRIGPDTPSHAPSASSQTRIRAGSTGPGMVARPLGISLKSDLP